MASPVVARASNRLGAKFSGLTTVIPAAASNTVASSVVRSGTTCTLSRSVRMLNWSPRATRLPTWVAFPGSSARSSPAATSPVGWTICQPAAANAASASVWASLVANARTTPAAASPNGLGCCSAGASPWMATTPSTCSTSIRWPRM